MSDAVVVVAQTGPAQWAAESFQGVPRVVPATIVIAAAGPGLEHHVASVRDELRDTLVASAPEVSVSRITRPSAADPREWEGLSGADRVGVLALLCPSDAVQEESWHAEIAGANWSVLPIFPKGANPSALFTSSSLKALNATFWTTLPTECVPAILMRAGLTTTDQRVFISYRRIDTQPLADQLFDALSHEGFDVFLDRFTVPPGVDFQRRLDQDLTDKSMVVLLESSGVPSSVWTQHEIDFAKRFRLGLVSLLVPDVTQPLRTIDEDDRMRLAKAQFVNAVQPWGPLHPDDLASVVLWVKAAHDRALFRRREYLRNTLNAALEQAGLPRATLDSSGFMVVTVSGVRHVFWITTRAAEVRDFEITHPRTLTPPGSKAVIVGLPTVEVDRQQRVVWLSGLCKLVCVDEDDLTEAARRIKDGDL